MLLEYTSFVLGAGSAVAVLFILGMVWLIWATRPRALAPAHRRAAPPAPAPIYRRPSVDGRMRDLGPVER